MYFELRMEPPTTTAQMHKVGIRNGKPYFYDPPAVREARQKLMAYLAKYRPMEPMEGPLHLGVSWLYSIKGKHRHGEYRDGKPDTDNLQKLLKDCMTALGFWKDDSQVAIEYVQKMWTEKIPGICIILEKIEQDGAPYNVDL